MFCTSCGTQATEGGAFCTGCGKPAAAPITTSAPYSQHNPTVSLAKNAVATEQGIPEGIKGWSWGAFLLNWVWAIGNRTWIGLLAIIPYVGVIVAIWLGIKGREMAWKNRQWDSVEHFNRVQKKWSRWAVGLTLGSAILGILAAIAVPAYESYHRRAQEKAFEEALASAQTQQAAVAEAPPPVVPAASVRMESGTIDSNADNLPATLTTVAGTLARANGADNNRFVTLNGNPLFSGEDANWQFPIRSFKLSQGREAILMASSGGRGNSCETMFFFLLADSSGLRMTPEFGTCSAQGRFTQKDDVITLVLPRMGGNTSFVLSDGTVTEDGKVVVLDDSNDPSK
jgi:type II secretory pathway pseudopilin PulG